MVINEIKLAIHFLGQYTRKDSLEWFLFWKCLGPLGVKCPRLFPSQLNFSLTLYFQSAIILQRNLNLLLLHGLDNNSSKLHLETSTIVARLKAWDLFSIL